MNNAQRILLVAAIAALALVPASSALAKKPPPPPDDAAALVAGVYTEVMGSGSEESESALPAPPASAEVDSLGASAETADAFLAACYWAQVRRYGKNLFGMTLWSYYQRIEWCANSSYITSRTRIRWGETSFPGWSFKGHTGSTTGGGVGYTYFRARTQGHFCLIQYFSCVQNAYPWIDMTVRRNGTYTYSTGG